MAASNAVADGPVVTETRGLRHPDGDGRSWDDSFESAGDGIETRGDEWSSVHWPKSDEDSPEYRHLANHPLKGSTFEFTAADLETLISANGFEPLRDNGRIIFGLRGVELVVAPGADARDKFKQAGRAGLQLKENRPDHQHFRCVIGVYDPTARNLTGFIASTVPCRQAVVGYVNGGEGSNLLPSGCYNYVCGPHKDRQGCLREDEEFTVLRTKRDMVFDIRDNWDLNFPADNLHPAFANKSAEFSSWGCQTVRGNHNKDDGSFSGEYNEFRNTLGLKPRGGSHGLKFSYVMLTGLEAAIASSMRKSGRDKTPGEIMKALGRLRHGSRGDRVRALQTQLGLPADGVFNAAVKKALVAQQIKQLEWADGVHSRDMDRLLGFDVFKPTPMIPPTPELAETPKPVFTVQPQPVAQPAPVSQPAPTPQPVAQPLPALVLAPAAPVQAPPAVATAAPSSVSAGASPAIQVALSQLAGAPAATAAVAAPMMAGANLVADATRADGQARSRMVRGAGVETVPARTAAEPRTVAKSSAKSRRVALVIGNGNYRQELHNPPRDAALITDELAKNGFKTIIGGVESGRRKPGRRQPVVERNGQDLDRAAMWARVKEFLEVIEDGSEAIIYYAGHGIQVGDQNYLVPIDATLESDDPVAELVPLDFVLQKAVNKAGSEGRVVVFLDACRNNPFGDRQLHALSEQVTARAMAVSGEAALRARAANKGLAPPNVSHTDHTARTFIAYATAPGAVAFDGAPGDGNSPFAAALGRHLGVRGLPLDQLVKRIGLDVQHRVEAMNKERVQDPWTTTNLKVDYFFKPRSWWPVIEMGLLGLIAGVITSLLVFPGGNQLVNNEVWAWAIGAMFGAVTAIGTLRWGSGSSRDAAFAFVGSILSFALALTVLQLIHETVGVNASGKVGTATRPVSQVVQDTAFAFKGLAVASGVFMLIGTIICWPRDQWTWRGLKHRWPNLLLPLLLGLSLLSLHQRLVMPGQIGLILVALIAGVLFATGNVLALKPQHGVFRGFGALTGAITIGLLMAVFFDLYFRLKDSGLIGDEKLIAAGLGSCWFALLGAQIGYCFSFYVPEHEPPNPPR